jgi:uncharacterized Zn finger protein
MQFPTKATCPQCGGAVAFVVIELDYERADTALRSLECVKCGLVGTQDVSLLAPPKRLENK